MKTFSLWIIIHLVFLSILGILSVQMSLYHSEILDFKSPFSVDSGLKSQFNLIISKERRPLFYGHFTPYRGSASHLRQTYGTASFQHRTSPHTVALHHISDKLTEPLPSSIEHLGRTYQLCFHVVHGASLRLF